MKVKSIQIPVSKDAVIRSQIEVLNGILNLTNQEIEVLSALIESDPHHPASKEARLYTLNKLGIKNAPTLNNVIRSLKLKGVLIENVKGYSFHPILPVLEDIQTFIIKLDYDGTE